jgi:hypothetical protein
MAMNFAAGAAHFCNQADPDGQREASDSVHQPQVRRKPGRQAAAEVPVAAQPQTGVRSHPGWTKNGVGSMREFLFYIYVSPYLLLLLKKNIFSNDISAEKLFKFC